MGINGLVFELRKPCCCLLWRLAHQTTCHPPSSPRALPFGSMPTCQGLFFPPCHSRTPGVERLSQETRVPPCRIGGKCAAWRRKNCGGFGAFTTRTTIFSRKGRSINQDNEFPSLLQADTVVPVVEREYVSAQRQALQIRAYSAEGKSEGFIARVPTRVRPTTIARLRLFSNDPNYGCPDLNQAVDEAIHAYLVSMGY